jgi:hypothetical protein
MTLYKNQGISALASQFLGKEHSKRQVKSESKIKTVEIYQRVVLAFINKSQVYHAEP